MQAYGYNDTPQVKNKYNDLRDFTNVFYTNNKQVGKKCASCP